VRFVAALLSVLLFALPAAAQDTQDEAAENVNVAEPSLPERIEIGLSTETIAITSDFSGVDLTIFGAIDNIDPLVQRQGRYDVFVVLEGPSVDLVTRRKARVLGIWMNVDSQSYRDVPESFLISSTRQPQDVTDLETLARLSLGVGQVRLRPETAANSEEDVREFTAALRRLKEEGGLYQEFPSGVRFISQSLFRAQLRLPANVPLGRHVARAYLFRQGLLVAQTQATLDIRKAGIEFQIYTAGPDRILIYGLASVLLALLVGWLGRVCSAGIEGAMQPGRRRASPSKNRHLDGPSGLRAVCLPDHASAGRSRPDRRRRRIRCADGGRLRRRRPQGLFGDCPVIHRRHPLGHRHHAERGRREESETLVLPPGRRCSAGSPSSWASHGRSPSSPRLAATGWWDSRSAGNKGVPNGSVACACC
jgi:uncharacterized protein (TIGR02186 family)